MVRGLEQDNSRTWFAAHRDVYEASVRGPLIALLDEVRDEFGTAHVFRPHRDVRFAADKSPYKTNCAAVAHGPSAAYYLEVSADGLFAASGMYQMARDQLQRFREAVHADGPGERLVGLAAEAEAAGLAVHGEALKTAPRGYPRGHPRIRFLRHKGLMVADDVPPGDVLRSRAALDHVTRVWRGAAGINGWLARHVGPSEEDPDRAGRR